MESYQLSLAPAKCQHLPITRHPDADKASNQYYVGNHKISNLSAVCDLGVVTSSNLKWCQHVCSIVSKAFIRSHQNLHCFSSNNVWILLEAYVTYIRTLLEYNTLIWSSFLKSDISMIESIQKHFTQKICFCYNISNTSYDHRFNMLNLNSYEYRRVEFVL